MVICLQRGANDLHIVLNPVNHEAPHHSIFTGRMHFQMPNQQHQSAKGKQSRQFLANMNSRSRLLYAIAHQSVCLSVTHVRPTEAVQIFGNISMALGTLAIR